MKNVFAHLDANMQHIYRKAIDADQRIDELKKLGMAKFSGIIEQPELFKHSGNKFMPYVSELSDDIEQLRQSPENPDLLTTILKKMELLLKLLGQFKQIT